MFVADGKSIVSCFVFDSCSTGLSDLNGNVKMMFITKMMKCLGVDDIERSLEMVALLKSNSPKLRQQDGYSCGYHALYFIHRILKFLPKVISNVPNLLECPYVTKDIIRALTDVASPFADDEFDNEAHCAMIRNLERKIKDRLLDEE